MHLSRELKTILNWNLSIDIHSLSISPTYKALAKHI